MPASDASKEGIATHQFRAKLHKAVTQKINFSDLYWVTDDENPVLFLMCFVLYL